MRYYGEHGTRVTPNGKRKRKSSAFQTATVSANFMGQPETQLYTIHSTTILNRGFKTENSETDQRNPTSSGPVGQTCFQEWDAEISVTFSADSILNRERLAFDGLCPMGVTLLLLL